MDINKLTPVMIQFTDDGDDDTLILTNVTSEKIEDEIALYMEVIKNEDWTIDYDRYVWDDFVDWVWERWVFIYTPRYEDKVYF